MKSVHLLAVMALSASSVASAQPASRLGETPFGAPSSEMLEAVVAGGAFEAVMERLPVYPGAIDQPLRDIPTYMAVPMGAVLAQRGLTPEQLTTMASGEKAKLLNEALPETRSLVAEKVRATLRRGGAAGTVEEFEFAKHDAHRLVAYMSFLAGIAEFKPLVEEFAAITAHWDVRLKELKAAQGMAADLESRKAPSESFPDSSARPEDIAAVRPANSASEAPDGRSAVERIEMLSPQLASSDPTEQEDAAQKVWEAASGDAGEAAERAAIAAFAGAAEKSGERPDNMYKWGVNADLHYIGAIGAASKYPNIKIYALGRLTPSAGFSSERDQEIVVQIKGIGASASDRASQKETAVRLSWMAAASKTSEDAARGALSELEALWAQRRRSGVPSPGGNQGDGSFWGRLTSAFGR